MEQKLETIEKSIQAGQSLSQQDENFLAALLAEEDGNKKGEVKKEALQKSRAAFEDSDFNNMSNKELVTALMKRIGQEFEARSAELKDHFGGALQQTALDNAAAQLQVEIKEARAAYGKEFDDAYDETLLIANRNPNLTIEQAFVLATSAQTRGKLSKMTKEKQDRDNKAASVVLPDSVSDASLRDSLKGKSSHAEAAQAIMDSIGIT
jgi:hypothetical protein